MDLPKANALFGVRREGVLGVDGTSCFSSPGTGEERPTLLAAPAEEDALLPPLDRDAGTGILFVCVCSVLYCTPKFIRQRVSLPRGYLDT